MGDRHRGFQSGTAGVAVVADATKDAADEEKAKAKAAADEEKKKLKAKFNPF